MFARLTYMYLCIDVGGTKTLCSVFDKTGKVLEESRMPTPVTYPEFITQLANQIGALDHKKYTSCAMAIPGKVNRLKGIGMGFGNLPWKNVPVGRDVQKIVNVPMALENDANAAALSEARELPKKYRRVLYVTVSTGIGTGFVIDGNLDPDMLDTEGGHMMLEYENKLQKWQDFASGKAIVKRFGKPASKIQSIATWKIIAHNIAYGLIEHVVILAPDIIVIGGGVGSHFEHFGGYINQEMMRYQSNVTNIPPIVAAKRPEEAVIYGCYELAKG